jgi:hypothetical protein
MANPLEALMRIARRGKIFRAKPEAAAARPPVPARTWRIRLGLFWVLYLACALAAFTAGYLIARGAD